MSLKGKNAIITGARSGIGLATMRLFARNGINCWAVIHRDDSSFQFETARLQEKYGIWINPVFMDLGRSDTIKEGVKQILQEKKPIDILINSAGITSSSRLFAMTSMDDMRHVMEVNFFGAMELIQRICRTMVRQHHGNIVNITSIAAYGEDTSQLEYAASKAALNIATKKLARELACTGIRVNAVAPGLTRTKMINQMDYDAIEGIMKGMPCHRLGTPEEIADVCLFLAGEQSAFINGETIKVDGGGFDLRVMVSDK